jgi:hypothetical protein
MLEEVIGVSDGLALFSDKRIEQSFSDKRR